ncbi:MAG: hypothetical protein AABZ67_17225 [Pseudomonadota bacterium]
MNTWKNPCLKFVLAGMTALLACGSMPIQAQQQNGTVEEIAELVRYLCGPHARWISGEVFLINGGAVRRAAN